MKFEEGFNKIAKKTSDLMGKPIAFTIALLFVLGWAATGPYFKYVEGWQMVINTGTTIITFLMIFLIQNSQNRDTLVLQLKLDELIRAVNDADNDLIDIENRDDKITEVKTQKGKG